MIPCLVTVAALAAGGSAGAGPRRVPREEILEAMRESHGYDVTTTTNGARFQSEVLRWLARRWSAHDPSQSPLFIDHADWFWAYLERTGLAADSVPVFIRLANDYGQDVLADYRRERVVERVEPGPAPQLALNVCIWWPEGGERPGKYSYEDVLSRPQLKVTNERTISYRLLDFGDMTVFDDIRGLKGRPTSGVLGFLFQLIGEGRVAENRMTLSSDGLQLCRARAEKSFFEVVSTVTVYPDGRTEKDLPPDRPDLSALEVRLKQPLKIARPPLECGRAP